ncbi:hypothetical protein KSS87_001433 [Heliosperma pusillum]|nr:hypothetical protein KSS87_001433 [Heliosperma pusillum]
MTRKMVARKGLVEATSNGVEDNENPTKAITNKEKIKTRPDVEVENRLISGNPGKTNSKKEKTLEVSKMAADAEVEEDGGDIEEDVENEMAVMTNNVTFDGVVTTTEVGGPLRKGRNGGWKRDGKMMVSADGIVIKMFMIDEGKYFVMTRDDVYDAFMLPCSSDRNEVLRTSKDGGERRGHLSSAQDKKKQLKAAADNRSQDDSNDSNSESEPKGADMLVYCVQDVLMARKVKKMKFEKIEWSRSYGIGHELAECVDYDVKKHAAGFSCHQHINV